MTDPNAIRGLCSMATRGLLDELAAVWSRRSGVAVRFQPIGGVEAFRRVAAGDTYDVVALASDAIGQLAAMGRLDGAGQIDLVRSGVGVAVRAGAARPEIASAQAVRRAVLGARRVGYSTGPSGVALVALFERWGLAERLRGRLVQAPPGTPVGSLLASGAADLGFQQMSELIGVEGIDLVGPLPDEMQITTVFSAAPGAACTQPAAVRALLRFLVSTDSAEAKRRHGMAPA